MHVQPEVHLHQVRQKGTAHCEALTVIQEVCKNRVLGSAWVAAAEQGLEVVAKLSFCGKLWVHCTNDTAVCMCVCVWYQCGRKRYFVMKVYKSASKDAVSLAHQSFVKTPRFSNWLCFFSCKDKHH